MGRNILGLQGAGFILLGGGKGLGIAVANALSTAGCRVVVIDRSAAIADETAAAIGGTSLTADLTDRAELFAAFNEAAGVLGSVRGIVDIIGMAMVKPIVDFTDTELSDQFDIVLRHALLTLQAGAAILDRGASFTFVGSMSGERAVLNQAIYGTAKAALHHLVRQAALEFGSRGIRVNAVSPGYIRTPRLNAILDATQWDAIGRKVPLGSAAQPYEIAGPILFLASALASHVTGQVLGVDGGISVVANLPDLDWSRP